MVHCGSAFEPGASGLPYYCASICVRSCCTWRASCVDLKPKKEGKNRQMGQRVDTACEEDGVEISVGVDDEQL